MSFQNNLCDLRVLGGEYVTAIRARRTRRWHDTLSVSECLILIYGPIPIYGWTNPHIWTNPRNRFRGRNQRPASDDGELLRDNDVVSVHMPLGAETKGLLNAMANLVARNVRAVLAGDPPITPVPR